MTTKFSHDNSGGQVSPLQQECLLDLHRSIWNQEHICNKTQQQKRKGVRNNREKNIGCKEKHTRWMQNGTSDGLQSILCEK